MFEIERCSRWRDVRDRTYKEGKKVEYKEQYLFNEQFVSPSRNILLAQRVMHKIIAILHILAPKYIHTKKNMEKTKKKKKTFL